MRSGSGELTSVLECFVGALDRELEGVHRKHSTYGSLRLNDGFKSLNVNFGQLDRE